MPLRASGMSRGRAFWFGQLSGIVELVAGVLGAAAVLVARPQLWGLAVAGQAGVERVLAIYRDEIDRVMGLLGARTLPEIRQLDALVARDRN